MNEDVSKIKSVIEEMRPYVQSHNGDLSFVNYENGVVFVAMQGACEHCPISTITLKMGIEKQIKQAVPAVQEVIAL